MCRSHHYVSEVSVRIFKIPWLRVQVRNSIDSILKAESMSLRQDIMAWEAEKRKVTKSGKARERERERGREGEREPYSTA